MIKIFKKLIFNTSDKLIILHPHTLVPFMDEKKLLNKYLKNRKNGEFYFLNFLKIIIKIL